MIMSPPLDVFWVRESLLYPCRAELCRRKTDTFGTKQPSSQQTAHYSEVSPRVPLTTSRLSFLEVREAFKLPSHSPRRIFSRREAAAEPAAAIFGAAWERDSAARAPQTLRGWRFFFFFFFKPITI